MPGSKVYDVTRPLNWGDGSTVPATPDDPSDDDAPAINAAMKAAVEYLQQQRREERSHTAQQLIHLPAGTYHLASPVVFPKVDNFEGYVWLLGAGENQTILRLKSAGEGGLLGSFDHPQPVLQVAQYTLGRENPGNENYQLFVTDLSIVVPEDQPHAVGLSFGAANLGAVRNVTVKAEGEGGHTGFALMQFNSGPGWIEHLTVEGFTTGVEITDGWGECYAFSDILIRNQRPGGVGLSVADKQLAFENLTIVQQHGDVQPVRLWDDAGFNAEFGGYPQFVCLNANISTSASDPLPPIHISRGHIYLRNLVTSGFGSVLINDHGNERVFSDGMIPGEYVSVHGRMQGEEENVVVTINAPEVSLGLPAPSAPEIDPGVFQEWAQDNFEVIRQQDLRGGKLETDKAWLILDPSGAEDDTELLQAAMSSGARYIGLLNTEPFTVSDTIHINTGTSKSVELIFGYMSEIHVTPRFSQRVSRDVPHDEVLFFLGSGSSDRLVFRGLRISAHDSTTGIGNESHSADFLVFQNNSSQTVVFEDIRCKAAPRHYRNAGDSIGRDVYFENVEFAYNGIFHDVLTRFDRQHVWARQFNVESPIRPYPVRYRGRTYSQYSIRDRMWNDGGELWIFSQKTGEHNGVFIKTSGGGRTELLSVYFNSARTNHFPVAPDATNFVVDGLDSEFSMVGQERIRTYYAYDGVATQRLPHGNRFGVLVVEGEEKVLAGTALPTYLKHPGVDPFRASDYEQYDHRNHGRVAGLVRVKN